MRKALKQIGLGTVALVLLCVAIRFAFFNSFSLYIPVTPDPGENAGQWESRIRIDHPEVLGTGTIVFRDGFAQIPIRALSPGETAVTVLTDDETVSFYHVLKVPRGRPPCRGSACPRRIRA